MSIKDRLKKLQEQAGGLDNQIYYSYMVIGVVGDNSKDQVHAVWKMCGKKYLCNIDKDHPEWAKAMEQHRREKTGGQKGYTRSKLILSERAVEENEQ